jgi:hypothetical protein
VATVLANGRAFLDMDTDWVLPDTIIRAGLLTGVAGDTYTIATVADGVGAGTLEVLNMGGGAKQLLYHFQDGVSTVLNFETAVAALVAPADFEIVTAGTPADPFAAATDQLIRPLAGGTAANAEQAPASFATGTNPGVVTSWAGMKEISGITHPSVGLYILTCRDRFPVALDIEAGWQAANASVYHVQVGALGALGSSIELRVLHLGTGALTDPALAGGERINVCAMVSKTQAGRMNPD